MRSLLPLLLASAVLTAVEPADATAPAVPPPKPEAGQALRPYLANAFSPYEPLYFLAQPAPLEAKFQFSFAILLLGRTVAPEAKSERTDGLYASYSQTSFWDLAADSSPFFDSSYRPEAWWHQGGLPHGWLGSDAVDLEGGIGHESNGRDGELSRSLNHVFIRPQVRWDLPDDWQVHLVPRLRMMAGDLSDNPEIKRYRGLFDLQASLGKYNGLKLATTTRVGSRVDRGSFQLDVSYPLVEATGGWVNCYVYGQWFNGFAESLRDYTGRSDRVLLGIAFVR